MAATHGRFSAGLAGGGGKPCKQPACPACAHRRILRSDVQPPRPPRRNPKPPRPPRAGDASPDGARPDGPALEEAAREPDVRADQPLTERRFPCRQCGAKLVYAPVSGRLACEHCGYANDIPQGEADIREIDFAAMLAKLAAHEETRDHLTIKCSACAAEIDKPPSVDALPCPFCGTDIITVAVSHKLLKPKALLPFAIERVEARARFRHWLRKLWFAPSELKRFARLERLAGLYIPYWTFDANTTSAYHGQRGDDYYVTVGSGKNRRTQRRTRWRSASGVVFNSFNDVLVLASRSLPRKMADALEPWRLPQLVPYSDAFLSGFQAESYTVDLVDGFATARELMAAVIRETVRQDIGGDRQQIHSVSTEYDHVTFKHILLPIWISAYRYRGRTYRYLVNGFTGKVQGERPYSWLKITAAVLGGALALAGVVWGLIETGVITP